MKLKNCILCINCETLYEEPGPCPRCASRVFLRLFSVLGTILEEDKRQAQDYRRTVKNNIPQPVVFPRNTLRSLGRFVTWRVRSGLSILNISIKWGQKMVRGLDLVASQAQGAKARSGSRL